MINRVKILSFFIALSFLIPSSVIATEPLLWQQFKAAKKTGSESTLPDFSYAGYNYSESDIPDTSGWTEFNVTNFGAIANDGKYDDVAIQAAINAAEAAGSVSAGSETPWQLITLSASCNRLWMPDRAVNSELRSGLLSGPFPRQ